MKVDHCKRCNKLYNKIKTPYCPICLDEIDRQFGIIRDYMDENPGSDISTILKDTKTEEKVLLFLIREERLAFSKKASVPCSGCGKLIKSGRYCSECTVKLTSDFSKAEKQMKTQIDKKTSEDLARKSKVADNTRGIHILKD